MKAHLVQLDIAWEDKQANFAAVQRLIRQNAISAGDLVILPEMFDTGFSMNTSRTADRDGITLEFLRTLARQTGAFIQGGRTVFTSPNSDGSAATNAGASGKASNIMTVVDPVGSVVAEYAKMKMFPIGAEPQSIQPGNRLTTWNWMGQVAAGKPAPRGDAASATETLRVSPLICYDLRFPELFRECLRMGAEVYALGACWLEGRHVHWKPLLIARAIENQAVVLAVNRVGKDPNSRYLGGSIAIGPKGDVLGELGDQEGVLSVEINPADVREWREKFPAWREVGEKK